jgi:hypothetical protein
VAEVEEAERRQEPPREPAPLRVLSVDEQAPNAELYAEVRRDWEDLAERSAPLASVTLPPATPAAATRPELKRRAPEQEVAKPGLVAKAVAAALVMAAGVLLLVWFWNPKTDTLPDVGVQAPQEQGALPGDTSLEATPAPPVRPSVPAPALERAEPPRMIATNINANPWARIEIDGVDYDTTPLGEVMLQEGPHRFRAFMPDGRVVERTEKISRSNSRILFE